MDFKDITRSDNKETGAIVLSITVSKGTVEDELADFYSVVAAHKKMEPTAPWNEIDDAAMQTTPPEHYRELRKDFIINRLVAEALTSLEIKPVLTPNIHVTDYPSFEKDFSFEVSLVEKPILTLTSYEPVEIETEDIEVTKDLVDGRIEMLLESHAAYEVLEDHPVFLGDCISVDIVTICNGKTVPHLTGKRMIFELDDGSMPDDFVRQLTDVQVGEIKTIDYSVKRSRAITNNDVDRYTSTIAVLQQLKKKVPLLTDEWVKANIEQASSVDELCEGVEQKLIVEVASVNRDTHARLANNALAKRLQGKIPDILYQAARNGLMDKLERELAEKGQTLDDYYEQHHMNEEELSVQMLIQSVENLRQGFALEALFDGRGMEVTDADIKFAFVQAFGEESYDMDSLKKSGKFRLVEDSAKRIVALNWLAETAKIKDC